MPILFALETLFSLWMVYDVYRRQAPYYWIFIILMPGGVIFYFIFVKLREDHSQDIFRIQQKLLEKKRTLEDIRRETKSSPSFQNKLVLAQALFDKGQFEEAEALFVELREQETDNFSVLFGLSCTWEAQGKLEQAKVVLEEITAAKFEWNNFFAATQLACLYQNTGKADEAIEYLERICKSSMQLQHHLLFAEALRQSGDPSRAKDVIETSLMHYNTSPKYIKKTSKPFFKRARKLLHQL